MYKYVCAINSYSFILCYYYISIKWSNMLTQGEIKIHEFKSEIASCKCINLKL